MRNRKRKRRKPREKYIVKFPSFAWEAWNLGFLNQEADIALTQKLGFDWRFSYGNGFRIAQYVMDSGHLGDSLTVETMAPMIRMISATGIHENTPKDLLQQNITDEEFHSIVSGAWKSGWQSFLNSVKSQVCNHYNFQDVMELQANHFFKMMKRDVLEFVNDMRKNPCTCCPAMSFMIIDTAEFTNRGVDLGF